ncbi:hypothetical protein OC861_007056, partial [Tilletia horrida]
MELADNILRSRPVYELQLLAAFDSDHAQRMRPLNLAASTAQVYNKMMERLMMYIGSLVHLCYGPDLNLDADPKPIPNGLERAYKALSGCDSTLKVLLKDMLETHSPESYWK